MVNSFIYEKRLNTKAFIRFYVRESWNSSNYLIAIHSPAFGRIKNFDIHILIHIIYKVGYVNFCLSGRMNL